jgi:hypothetical protein
VAQAVTSGPAGMAVTELRCPLRHHMVTVYKDIADGSLFAVRGAIYGDALRDVPCPRCGRSYQVDPRELRRAAWEKRRSLVLRD